MVKRLLRSIEITMLICATLVLICAAYGHFQLHDDGKPTFVVTARAL